jgi:hypothetical protein
MLPQDPLYSVVPASPLVELNGLMC